jgi:hypothetical protein
MQGINDKVVVITGASSESLYRCCPNGRRLGVAAATLA